MSDKKTESSEKRNPLKGLDINKVIGYVLLALLAGGIGLGGGTLAQTAPPGEAIVVEMATIKERVANLSRKVDELKAESKEGFAIINDALKDIEMRLP